MMESFFQLHVLPEFKSEHGFLRYRVSLNQTGRLTRKLTRTLCLGMSRCREVRILRYDLGS